MSTRLVGLVALAFIVGCPGPKPRDARLATSSVEPAPPAAPSLVAVDFDPTPGCAAVTRSDVENPTDARAACIVAAFSSAPHIAAIHLSAIEESKGVESLRFLGSRVPAEVWFAIATGLEARPTLATEAFALARTDPDLLNDADIALFVQLSRGGDPVRTKTARDELLARVSGNTMFGQQLDDRQKLMTLDIFQRGDDEAAIARVCQKPSAPIAWRCVELDPTAANIAAVARLPVISSKDLDRLAAIPGVAAQLPGLDCRTRAPRSVEDVLSLLLGATTERSAVEVSMYSRLVTKRTPEKVARCLLEEASIACVHLINRNKTCPVLHVFADYLRLQTKDGRMEILRGMMQAKTRAYSRLEMLQKNLAKSNETKMFLFHVHILLAESLVGETHHDKIWDARYHIRQAWTFWPVLREPTVTFGEMLTEPTRQLVCDDKSFVPAIKKGAGCPAGP